MTADAGRCMADGNAGDVRVLSGSRRGSAATTVMGLAFANALGLAAGIDRTGANLARLTACGVGHIEIGTVKDARTLAIDRTSLQAPLVVGVNIGSARPGLDDDVIDDYARMLNAVWDTADYVVANMSAPLDGRNEETPGVERLLARLKAEQRDRAAAASKRVPLLLKSGGGRAGAGIPQAIQAARDTAIDGVVLVSACLDRLCEIRDFLGSTPVISVGGVTCAEEVAERLAAGAALVQVHSAYESGGSEGIREIVDEL